MNFKRKFLKIAILLLGVLWMQSVYSQKWDGERTSPLWDLWSINLNAGVTSYFGDLSSYDPQFDQKLQFESGPAMGLIITKHLSRTFAISGQFLYGSMQAKHSNIAFATDFLEYNLHGRINFVNLFDPHRSHRLSFTGYVGVGQFFFSTQKTVNEDLKAAETTHQTGVPEFLYFFGTGFNYELSQKIGISLDLSLRQCQNDRLDDYIANEDFDYYSYLSIGVTYNISSFYKSPVRNKSTLVYSGEKLKHLKE